MVLIPRITQIMQPGHAESTQIAFADRSRAGYGELSLFSRVSLLLLSLRLLRR